MVVKENITKKRLISLPDIYLDEGLSQHRFQKESFGDSTWLLRFILTIPFNMTMSFPYVRIPKHYSCDICPVLRSHYSEGIIEIERLPQFIKVYEVEHFC